MRFKKERRSLIREFRELKKRGEMRNFLPDSEDGIIRIPLKGDEESLFASYNSAIPSQDALDYLREAARALLPTQKAEIVLEGDCNLQSVEERYKNYLAYSINKNEKEKRTFSFLSLAFLFIGAATVLSSYFFAKYDKVLIAETIDTIGGFFIWTASEFWFLERREYNKAQLEDLRLYASPWTNK